MKLESMYQEIILDHYRNPHHKGLREPFDAEVHHVNPTCGDEVTLRVQARRRRRDGRGRLLRRARLLDQPGLGVGDDRPGDRAQPRRGDDGLRRVPGPDAGQGRRVSAAASVDGDLEDVLEDAVAFAGVSKYPARIKCALLGWMAWKDATAQAAGVDEHETAEEMA